MKIAATIVISFLAASLLTAAETNTNDQVKAAITKLKAQPNYSWIMKLDLPGMQFTPEPQHGKIGTNGIALVTQDFNGQTVKAAFKEAKVVVFIEDQWQTVSSPDSTDFSDRPAMTARWLTGSGTAAQEADELSGKVKALTAGEAGLWSGDLTEKGAGDLLAFGSRSGVKNAKGTAKFWIKDGMLVKFQSQASGKAAFGPDQEVRDIDLTRTVEIQEVGKTTVEIPEEAKKKLESK